MKMDEVYSDLLEVVSTAGARLDVPAESEAFFSEIVARFSNRDELIKYVSSNLSIWFRSLNDQPRWVQEADWQYFNGKPMMFIGQIDIKRQSGIFHDDASLFVFYAPDAGITKNVIQVV